MKLLPLATFFIGITASVALTAFAGTQSKSPHWSTVEIDEGICLESQKVSVRGIEVSWDDLRSENSLSTKEALEAQDTMIKAGEKEFERKKNVAESEGWEPYAGATHSQDGIDRTMIFYRKRV